MLWEQAHMAVQLIFNYSVQNGTAPMGWIGESPCSTRSFWTVLFSLGCCGSVSSPRTPELRRQLPQHHWHIIGIGSEDVCGGWRDGKGAPEHTVIHGDRSVSSAETSTCHCCLSYHSGQEWQWLCGGGERSLLKDRAASWDTIRETAFKGGNTTKIDQRILKDKINAKAEEARMTSRAQL